MAGSGWVGSLSRVIRVDRDVLVPEVGEEQLGLRALPGQPDLVLDLGPLGGVLQRRRSRAARRKPCGADWTPSIVMSSSSGAMLGSAMPAAWEILPQFASPPYSAVLTSGELATDLATRCDRVGGLPRARPPDRTRRAPSPSLTIQQRELPERRVERLAEPQLVGGVSCSIRRLRTSPLHCRITVSLGDSWPSTLTRSNERVTVTPSSRSAVSGASSASVWTNTRRVAKFGEIMPAPFAWALMRTVPACSSTLKRHVLREGVGCADRFGEVFLAVGSELACSIGDPAHDVRHRERDTDHAGGRDGDGLFVSPRGSRSRPRPASLRRR